MVNKNNYDEKGGIVYLNKNQTKGFLLTGTTPDYDVYTNKKGDTFLYYGKDEKTGKFKFQRGIKNER